ncbi:MAG: efflux RND transporter periplasmic adaptor subunit [Desulforhopalus sp.]
MTKKKNIQLFVLAMAAAALLLTGCQEKKQTMQAAKGPVEVDVQTLKTQEAVIDVELPGRTTAFRVAEVRPQVNGIIQKRLFAEGSEVQAGELLYQIDPAVYQAKFDSAKAALVKAQAVEHLARIKAERYARLVKTRAVSELDQAEIDAEWKEAKADVASAEAALNSARIDLDHTRIAAPISGRVGKSMFTEGALVTEQQGTALAVIQQLDPLYVDVTRSSSELLRMKKNLASGRYVSTEQMKSRVRIMLEDGSEYAQEGSVEFSDVTVNPTTGAVTLRILVANPGRELLPGMFVRAQVVIGMKKDAILVPAASISRNSKGEATVMLVDGDSKVASRVIHSGRNIGDKVLVESGLKAGDVLITAGFQKIRPGIPVKGVEQHIASTGRAPVKSSKVAADQQTE